MTEYGKYRKKIKVNNVAGIPPEGYILYEGDVLRYKVEESKARRKKVIDKVFENRERAYKERIKK